MMTKGVLTQVANLIDSTKTSPSNQKVMRIRMFHLGAL